MMRNMERGPALPPGAKARAERNAARRAARKGPGSGPARTSGIFTRRFVLVSIVLAAAVGYLAFSFLWPNMPQALYAGAAAAALVLAIQVGFRLLRQRLEAQRQQGPS
jgi:hypothetical protein